MYTINEHIHRYSIWTAARASQRGLKDFKIETLKRILEIIYFKNEVQKFFKSNPNKDDFNKFHKRIANEIINKGDDLNIKLTYGRASKNRYRHYLKDGFYLFLLTGGRREEVVDLKWSDIYTLDSGIKTFIVENLKVKRIKKNSKEYVKYFPINKDLEDFLIKLGMDEKLGKNEFILYPERNISSKSIMDILSKSFTYYKEAAGINKNISLSNLRKTYISWHNLVLGIDTGLVTNSADRNVLKKHYIDPKILSAVEKAALEVRVFGKNAYHIKKY